MRGHRGRVGVCRRLHDPEHPVSSDAASAVAQGNREFGGQVERAVGVGKQHEVVAGAVTLDERDAVHSGDGTARRSRRVVLNRTSRCWRRGGPLADAQLLLPNGDDVALHQLPTAARLGLAVDADRAFGEQHLRVRSRRYDVRQLQELPEPDDIVPGDDFPHAVIIAHPVGRTPSTLPHYPTVLHRGGYPDGS